MGLYEDLFDFNRNGKVDADDDLMLMQMTKQNNDGGGGNNNGCYIATCVYSSYDCPPVWMLRRFRDTQLASTPQGRLFIRIYYAVSPTIVKQFGKAGWFQQFWKKWLDRMVARLQSQGVENTPYRDRDW